MKNQKSSITSQFTANPSSKATLRSQSPFKSLNPSHNKNSGASKDLESYILRNSTESLNNINNTNIKTKTEYNFKEVD